MIAAGEPGLSRLANSEAGGRSYQWVTPDGLTMEAFTFKSNYTISAGYFRTGDRSLEEAAATLPGILAYVDGTIEVAPDPVDWRPTASPLPASTC